MKLLPKAGEVKLLTHEGEELKIKKPNIGFDYSIAHLYIAT